MIFTPSEYYLLSELVFQDWYPGYRKNVVESPNGDGNWDTEKRYAHVAHKYLKTAVFRHSSAFDAKVTTEHRFSRKSPILKARPPRETARALARNHNSPSARGHRDRPRPSSRT